MSSPRAYRRLPGRPGLTLLGTASLWLGPDHLLAVRNLYFAEEYRRFDYGEIQALLLRRTRRRIFWAAALAALATLFGFLTLTADPGPIRWVPAVPFALFLALFAVNWLRGPTCACHLRTAVHTEPLPSLRRVRPARRAFALVRHRVRSVQGRADGGARRTDAGPRWSGGTEEQTSPVGEA